MGVGGGWVSRSGSDDNSCGDTARGDTRDGIRGGDRDDNRDGTHGGPRNGSSGGLGKGSEGGVDAGHSSLPRSRSWPLSHYLRLDLEVMTSGVDLDQWGVFCCARWEQ